MSTSLIPSSTQNLSAPSLTFSLIEMPEDIQFQIFSKSMYFKDIQSLLLTNRQINHLISSNIPFWTVLLEKHFRDSYDPSQSGFNAIEGFKDIIEIKNGIKSNICEYREMYGHTRAILAEIVQNDQLTTISWDNKIGIWDLKKEKNIKFIPYVGDIIAGAAIHKDMLYLATDIENQGRRRLIINIFDLKTGIEQQPLGGEVYFIAAQGDLLFSASASDKTIDIWDMNTRKQLKALKTEGERITFLLPHKDILFFGDKKGNIKTWNFETQDQSIDFKLIDDSIAHKDYEITYILVHKGKLFTADSLGDIVAWDLVSRKKLYSLSHEESITCLGAYADMLFSASINADVVIWDAETGEKLQERSVLAYESPIILEIHRGKLLVGCEECIKIFDFGAFRHYEQKAATPSIKADAELLVLAVIKKDRNKILECVDNLLAANPKNREFIEILCETTDGSTLPLYEFSTGVPFDYRKSIQSAKFHLVEKAVLEFVSILERDRNIQLNLIEFGQVQENLKSEEQS